jgi:hypothetical protein
MKGFEVPQEQSGRSSVTFDYRIMAKRNGHENEGVQDVT